MITPDKILADYREGLITRGQALSAVALSVTESNVSLVMSSLPADIRDELSRWASDWSPTNRVMLTGNMADEEAAEIKRQFETARVVIQDWHARNGEEPGGSEQRANGREVVGKESLWAEHTTG